MRKRTNDTINYLLGLYDCPFDYEYVTKTNGKDRVRKGCLNLIAGTTPSFMQSTFDEKLMDEGFASRTFYIYAMRNRKNQFWIPPLTTEQESFKLELLDHIKKLTELYGQIKISPETAKFLDEWWDDTEQNRHKRANKSLKLVPYYARKNIHVQKIAMALHFSDSTEMEIPLETFKKAITVLDSEEKMMHLALTLEGTNALSKVARKLLEMLTNGEKDYVNLHAETFEIIDRKGLDECLEFLSLTNQITSESKRDEITDSSMMFYRIKK